MSAPMPEGYATLMPAIYVNDVKAAVAFYQKVFDATIVDETEFGELLVSSDLRIGDSIFSVTLGMEGFGLAAPADGIKLDTASIHFHTMEVDKFWQAAVDAGAAIINEPADRAHGHRSGAVRDPFGHRWAIMKRVENLTKEELARRMADTPAA